MKSIRQNHNSVMLPVAVYLAWIICTVWRSSTEYSDVLFRFSLGHQTSESTHFQEWTNKVWRFRFSRAVESLRFGTKRTVWFIPLHGSRGFWWEYSDEEWCVVVGHFIDWDRGGKEPLPLVYKNGPSHEGCLLQWSSMSHLLDLVWCLCWVCEEMLGEGCEWAGFCARADACEWR